MGIRGIWKGYEEELSVGLEEILTNCSSTEKRKAEPFPDLGGDLWTQTENIFEQ